MLSMTPYIVDKVPLYGSKYSKPSYKTKLNLLWRHLTRKTKNLDKRANKIYLIPLLFTTTLWGVAE